MCMANFYYDDPDDEDEEDENEESVYFTDLGKLVDELERTEGIDDDMLLEDLDDEDGDIDF